MAMRYPPDRRLPSTDVRRSGPPLPTSLPPGYSEALTSARRYNRAYSRHSQLYQAFGPIPPRPTQNEPVTAPPTGTETRGGTMILPVALVIVLVVAATAWLGSMVAPGTSSPSLPPNTSYSVIGGPSVSADFINQVLAAYGSPVVGHGQYIYDDGVKYGVDPVFALAFFLHESSLGRAGEARSSLSIGNLRCIPSAICRDGYAWFGSWDEGIDAWYQLIKDGYVGGAVSHRCPCITIAQIIPVYAPRADNNDEGAYTRAVEHEVDTWRKGVVVV